MTSATGWGIRRVAEPVPTEVLAVATPSTTSLMSMCPTDSARVALVKGVSGMSWIWDALGLLGVLVTLAQLGFTKTLARATHDAVVQTNRQSADYDILLLIPKMTAVENELSRLVDSPRPSTEDLRRTFIEWREVASEVRGFLHVRPAANTLEQGLQSSLTSVGLAKKSLLNEGDSSALIASALERMDSVCEATIKYSAELRVALPSIDTPSTLWEWAWTRFSGRGTTGSSEAMEKKDD
jgi:hypothetical protein